MNFRILFTLSALSLTACATKSEKKSPNIIVVFADDQGYEDLGCYGSPLIKTPCVDKMATEGLRLTDFYASSSVSSASRAGLLTGKMNHRNSVKGVYFPNDRGMDTDQVIVAETLKEQGYATACFGKWHLGDVDGSLPTDRGFDEYFGIPYSNDMYPSSVHTFSKDIVLRNGYTPEQLKGDMLHYDKYKDDRRMLNKRLWGKLPLFEGKEVIEYPCDQSTLTRRYFDRTIDFIKKSEDTPFFVFLTPAMPHIPLFASEQFAGKSARGLYGDVVEEIDWNMGRLLDYLDKEGLSENTLVVYATDNGPWLGKQDRSGSAGIFRDGKFSVYEGGVRVPCIIRWLGTVPAGKESQALVSSLDFFPTFMHYAGETNVERDLDGNSIHAFFENPDKGSGRNEYYYVHDGKVRGVRQGEWKLLPNTGLNKMPKVPSPELYNLRTDPGERENLMTQHPEIVARLQSLIDAEAKREKTF